MNVNLTSTSSPHSLNRQRYWEIMLFFPLHRGLKLKCIRESDTLQSRAISKYGFESLCMEMKKEQKEENNTSRETL